uniref:Uncharacterized protein n=1 Tax=Anguilla anguilla TaxID=7936 RepID=A0A0E9VC38_ANGAN
MDVNTLKLKLTVSTLTAYHCFIQIQCAGYRA